MNENIKMSLQILILNDLLQTNVIDKDTFNKALNKLDSINTDEQAA